MSKRVVLTNGVGRQWIQPHRCGRRPVAFFPQPALEELFAVTEVGDMAVDKRKALQPVLDSIEKGWQIVKPHPLIRTTSTPNAFFNTEQRDTNK